MKIDWAWVEKTIVKRERLGSGKKGPAKAMRGALKECMKEAKALARPKVISAVRPLDIRHGKISSGIKGATRASFFLATIGGALEDRASSYMKNNDELKGYLLDRIGSMAVETLAESFETQTRKARAAKGESVSMRFSPGYCDWPIEEQRSLDKILDFSRAGVRLTESCMMVPRKSISGMVAIGPKSAALKKLSPCVICELKKCWYRRD